jgi:hypothetical protein
MRAISAATPRTFATARRAVVWTDLASQSEAASHPPAATIVNPTTSRATFSVSVDQSGFPRRRHPRPFEQRDERGEPPIAATRPALAVLLRGNMEYHAPP